MLAHPRLHPPSSHPRTMRERIADIGDASKRIGIAGEGSGANIASGNKTSHQVASV